MLMPLDVLVNPFKTQSKQFGDALTQRQFGHRL
jgi:hypothetical protein